MKKYWYRIFRKTNLGNLKLKFMFWFYDQIPKKYCWADCVSWAFDTESFNPFKIGRSGGCCTESKERIACYCGCWVEGKHTTEITDKEMEETRNRFK